MKSDNCLTPLTKTNLKWIQDLNVRPGTLKLLERNVWKKLFDIVFGKDLLDTTKSAKISKWDYVPFKSFCKARETITKIKIKIKLQCTE